LIYKSYVEDDGQGIQNYYAEMENFQRIYAKAGLYINEFVVETKDGKTIEYGHTTDSKLMSENGFSVLVWFINKVTDRNGNYMTYHYEDFGRQKVLSRIEYTANDNNTVDKADDIKPHTIVNFEYIKTDRKDKSYAYIAGSKIESNRLLEKIKIITNYTEHYKSYQLKYTEGLFNYLTEFQEWGTEVTTNGKSRLNSLTFEYGENKNEFKEIPQTDKMIDDLYAVNNGQAVYIPGNFNGDGLTDYLVLPYEFKNSNKKDARYKGVYIYVNDNKSNRNGFKSYNIGSNTVSNSEKTISILSIFRKDGDEYTPFNKKALYPIDDVDIMMGDMNGDGIDDIVVGRELDNEKHLLFYDALLSKGIVANYSLGYKTIQLDEEDISILPVPDKASQHVATLLDSDGDGTLEFFAFNNDDSEYFLTSFVGDNNLPKCLTTACTEFNIAYNTSNIKITDSDGDGKNEAIFTYWYLNEKEYNIIFNLDIRPPIYVSGNNPLVLDNVTPPQSGAAITSLTNNLEKFVDLNGDGKFDRVEIGEHGLKTFISKANKQYEEIETNIPYIYNDPVNDDDDILNTNSDNFYYYFIDINSDGFSDCVVTNPKNYSIDVYLNEGLGSSFKEHKFKFKEFNLLWSGSQYMCEFVDLNGDGILEIQMKSSSSLKPIFISLNLESRPSRLLHKVYDSYANETKISYTSIAQELNYSTDLGVSYPYRALSVPIYVVDELTLSTPDGGTAKSTYEYKNLVGHLEGKGSLGFTSIISTDELNKLKTESTSLLDQKNVLLRPNKTTTWLTSTTPDTKLSETISHYTIKTFADEPKKKWMQLDKTESFDYTNQAKTEVQYQNYDDYGNPQKSITKIYDIQGTLKPIKHTTTENVTYKDCDWWATYLPEKLTTAVNRAGYSGSNARTVEYAYNLINGNLEKETTDPSTTNEIITTYSNFDSFGNPKVTTMKAYGEAEERSITVTFDSTGRFITSRKDSQGNEVETMVPNLIWGLPASVTDLYGKVTAFTYDNYGRLHTTTDYLGNQSTTTFNWVIEGQEPESNYNSISSDYDIDCLFYINSDPSNTPESNSYFDQFGMEVLSSTQQFGNKKSFAFKKYDARGRLIDESGSFRIGDDEVLPTLNVYTYDELNRIKTSVTKQYKLFNINTLFTANVKEPISYNYPVRMVEVKGTKTPITNSDIISKTTTYDVTGKVITVQDPGGYLHYSYNNFNELQQVKNVKDGIETILTTNTYDDFGRQESLDDNNAGKTTYTYNPFDELKSQTDAKGNITEITYDNLGRIDTKKITDADGKVIDYVYTYYEAEANGDLPDGFLQLKSERGQSGNITSYTYDEYGRLKDKMDDLYYYKITTSYTYNTFGDIQTITYPDELTIDYEYDDIGTFYKASSGETVIYEITGTNHLGQITDYQYSDGKMPVNQTFNELGMPATTEAKNSSNTSLFNWAYDFNKTNGNLNSRSDIKNNETENFQYDALHRLTHINDNDVPFVKYTENSNIKEKVDAGDYTYEYPGGKKINALTSISNDDQNIPLLTEDIEHTAFDRPHVILEDKKSYILSYGAQNQRQRTSLNINGQETNRFYSGNCEIVDIGNGQKTSICYLSFANSIDAIYVKEGDTGQFYYSFTDYLGSILKVVDANGNTKEEQSFDAWGRNRNPQNWDQQYFKPEDAMPKTLRWLNRGYTGHEHLYEFGLINMNNRLYDPIVGRMLAVDNEVPDAHSTQGYNRYAYAMNNPLKYTDPSGDVIVPILLGAAIGVAGNGIGNLINQDPFFYNAGGAAFWGGVGGAFSFGIGEAFSGAAFNTGLQILAHGHLGGLMTAGQGGKYGHGFLSGQCLRFRSSRWWSI